MTQDSWMYDCGVGDAREIYAADWHLFNEILFLTNRDSEGVVDRVGMIGTLFNSNNLEPTNPAANNISIDTGVAIVLGVLYLNSAAVVFDVTGPGGGAQTDLIVLRYTAAAQTVRLAHKQGTPGGAAATLQQDAAVWEIPIATIVKAAGTNVTTLTDSRVLCHSPLRLNGARIDAGSVTPTQIANRTRTFFVPAATGLNVTDSAALQYSSVWGTGIPFFDNKVSRADSIFAIPQDFVSGLITKPVLLALAGGAGNDIYDRTILIWGALGEAINTGTHTVGYQATTVATAVYAAGATSSGAPVSSVAVGDFVQVEYSRDATNILDTIDNTVYLYGWLITYTADS